MWSNEQVSINLNRLYYLNECLVPFPFCSSNSSINITESMNSMKLPPVIFLSLFDWLVHCISFLVLSHWITLSPLPKTSKNMVSGRNSQCFSVMSSRRFSVFLFPSFTRNTIYVLLCHMRTAGLATMHVKSRFFLKEYRKEKKGEQCLLIVPATE